MQCVHDPMFSSHSTNAVANIEKIRSKYCTAELDKELAGKTRLATMIYLANLRRTKSACVLKNDFLCLLDGDWNGNLKEIQKQNLVFLKMLKCKNGEGNKQHLPLCLRDDRLPKFGCFF